MPSQRLFAHSPISKLPGLGSTIESKFNHLGIFTIRDLLTHFPLRYEDRTTFNLIANVAVGQHTTVQGIILNTEIRFMYKKRMLVCTIKDRSGIFSLRFINFYNSLQQSLQVGKWVRAYGEVKASKTSLEMIHPQIQIRDSEEAFDLHEEEKFTPIYPTTYGLTQNQIRKFINLSLLLVKRNPNPEILPAELLNNLPSIEQALNIIHEPQIDTDIVQLENGTHPAKKRLIIEELLAYQLSMQITKLHFKAQKSYAMAVNHQLVNPFLAQLPFAPTQAQKRVVAEIWQDMAKNVPMMRLVQGDVGSGKTVVAALAALCAIENGKQVVLMAPTEILAEQHAINFTKWFNELDLNVAFLAGKTTAKKRKELLSKLEANEIHLLVGTHAVFMEDVKFADLGLVIIDEQHRFGVDQRLTLWEKGVKDENYPHQLIMTATPIPRTLAMTAYADLDVSIIDELPPGRTPITTVVLPTSRRDQVIERIAQACHEGKQAYWVCTLVEESEILEAQAAEVAFAELTELLPNVKVGLVHGKMKPAEKQQIMQLFKQGDIQLLVATTVIEVGVDVPNASLMIIENAERLGLSQLHQLRGRVGRGKIASHCVLMYKPPLSHVTKQRLNVMRDSNDGFVIAEKDLEIRGAGEILGTRQIGVANFKVVDLMRDQHLINQIQKYAVLILEQYPQSASEIVDFWLPDRTRYINA
ncbi:ATP-dependent DNA helicase RecG [Orbaceae bacterium ac157xtp]